MHKYTNVVNQQQGKGKKCEKKFDRYTTQTPPNPNECRSLSLSLSSSFKDDRKNKNDVRVIVNHLSIMEQSQAHM
ncbi:hypothetical protein DERF_005193 [Dermatophagoides farinae]|uniref:Uncharacterized protein n=1 Tax=Dermatophagoides farinae TaxID=6954 RepID=A0A922I5D4_DERFA|nr:hypothetical protein DERF_005193 [Dermatophagoides farinae]